MEYLDVVDENNNLTGKTEERNIIQKKRKSGYRTEWTKKSKSALQTMI